MDFLISVLSVIFVLGLLVFVHELGHFAIAKFSGMKVIEFALGFGPALFKKQEGETLYSIRIIPLGGYNKIAGMDPDDEEDPRNFNYHPLYKKLAVVFAGSFMNLLLPIILFTLIFVFSGIPKTVDIPVFGAVNEGMPAAMAGLQKDDRVLSVDGKNISTWTEFSNEIQTKANQKINLVIKRGEKDLNISLIPTYHEESKRAIIGVLAKTESYYPSFFEAFSMSFKQTIFIIKSTIMGFYKIIFDSTQKADLAGPIGIAQMAGQFAQHGMASLLSFAAFLSINLGILNLLPVPVLDGGHIVMLVIEGIKGKALNPKIIQRIQLIGLVLLLSLMLFATVSDIRRFFE